MADAKDGADLQALARDWITIVQSELSGIAADREAQEGFSLLLGLWATAATRLVDAMPRPAARDDPPARPPPAAAAPDPRDAQIDDLARRVAELEARLAAEPHAPGPARKPRRRPG